VPATAKTEAVIEMEDYFRELIRGIDSSLLEEWERMMHPELAVAVPEPGQPARPASFDITRDVASFRRLVRTAIFGFLQDIAARDFESASVRLRTGEAGSSAEDKPLSDDAKRIAAAFAPYFELHDRFRLDPEGRATKHTHWSEDPAAGQWRVSQVLVDPAEENDWEAVMVVSLTASRAENRAVLHFESLHPIGAAGAAGQEK
jgi:hypothetical protein